MQEEKSLDTSAAALKTFASLLETHRYYGSVAATSRETLRLQERLPKLFRKSTDGKPCCSAPSLALPTPSNTDTKSSPIGATSVKQILGKPSLFHQTSITTLPLHILEGCNRIFQTMWAHKLRKAASKQYGPNLQVVVKQLPLQPAAVVTLVRCLDAIPTPSSNKGDEAKEQPRYSMILPIILAFVMDWRLQDGTTSTVRMEFPGVLSGNLWPQQRKHSVAATIDYVEMELDYDVMLKSMGDAMDPLVRTAFTKGWLVSEAVANAKAAAAAAAASRDSKTGVAEDQVDHCLFANGSTTTPLDALFAAAEKEHKTTMTTPLQALFAESTHIAPENDPLHSTVGKRSNFKEEETEKRDTASAPDEGSPSSKKRIKTESMEV